MIGAAEPDTVALVAAYSLKGTFHHLRDEGAKVWSTASEPAPYHVL